MWQRVLRMVLSAVILAGVTAWAQPAEFAPFSTDDGPRRGGMQARRWERVTEYLELSEAQTEQWRQVLDEHFARANSRRAQVDELRSEFRRLAGETSPNLERLGQVALDIHRQMESARGEKDQLMNGLEELLTPEQAERFAALRLARDLAGPRFGPQARRHRRRGSDPRP